MPKLYIIGTGPGSSDYITLAAVLAVKSADILVGSQRALDLFPKFEGETLVLRARNMGQMMEKSVVLVDEGNDVAILSTGDPGFSGLLKPILKLRDDLELEVIPGISSLQLAAARLQIPWDEANILTLHGKGNSGTIMDIIDNGKPTIVLPDFRVEQLAQFLLENDIDPQRKVAVCEKLSYPDEIVVKTTLKEVAEMKFGYLCVLVIY
ncbi:MAG: precorrin-6y C5,15-methyltransferase (decarboxylating) subunit CbiE [Methanobacteriaceae archaeon]